MVSDAGDIRLSIARTRMRPYEVEFKNGSIIMGYVGNNAVRGKCLPGNSMIVLADGKVKEIKNIIKVIKENTEP